MSDFLQDNHGNKSSKRLWGSIILGIAVVMAIVLFGYSLYQIVADASTAKSIIDMFLITGGSLLGIGVLENGIFKKNDK